MSLLLVIFILSSSLCEIASLHQAPLIDLCEIQSATTSQQTKQTWHPASYRGLIVGKSNRADMLRILGKPKRKDFADDHETWYGYDNVGEFTGEFTVAVDKRSGRILFMFLNPQDLSKESAIQHFGKDYLITRYDFCPGFDDAEAAPVFESPQGNALYVEYRQRGLAIFVDDSGTVNIRYLAEPIGFRSKRECQQALRKYRAAYRKKAM